MKDLIQVLVGGCLALLVVLAPARGDGGVGGDGNGWGNLPGGFKTGVGIGGLDGGGDEADPRLVLRFEDIADGVKLRLAPEMSGSLVAISASGAGTAWLVANGRDIVLPGAALLAVRDAGISTLTLRIVALDGSRLSLELRLEADGSATVIVR
jgi:hypothetical protein